MLETWVIAVRWLIDSASPISRSLRPDTSKRKTSTSRGVRSCAAEAAGGASASATSAAASAAAVSR